MFNWVDIVTFLIGGGGLASLLIIILKEFRSSRDRERAELLDNALVEEKGAGLLITTSSEAIAVFKIALETANVEAKRLRAERDELFARVQILEAQVRDLQRRITE